MDYNNYSDRGQNYGRDAYPTRGPSSNGEDSEYSRGSGVASSTGTRYGDMGARSGQGDLSSAVDHASSHTGSNSDRGLFGDALSILQSQRHHLANQDINEHDAVQQHQSFFGSGRPPQQADSGSIGAAAAMQALKMFTGGQGGGSGGQNEFIGMAMGEASKLFEKQSSTGSIGSGASKQDAISSAAKMAMQMYMKSDMGAGGSGGGLMSVANRLWS